MTNIIKAIQSISPKAEWVLVGNEYSGLRWDSVEFEKPSEAQIQEKIAELKAAEPLRLLRQHRNQLLAQSDWMAVSDRVMSPEQIAYRQSLRDMPANNPDVALNEAGELINVTWPTEPQ